MPPASRILAAALVFVCGAAGGALCAQASPFVALDDPLLPLFEHLVARGDIADPSPNVRPFRRGDALRVIAEAGLDSDRPAGRLAAVIVARWGAGPDRPRVIAAARGGGQVYSDPRRDPLQPVGLPRGVEGYAELTLGMATEQFLVMTRTVAENRIQRDPDWAGDPIQRDKRIAFRAAEGYAAATWGRARLVVGALERNWGPPGLEGLALSHGGYQRPALAADLSTRLLTFSVHYLPLKTVTRTDSNSVQRHFAAHRVAFHPSPRLTIAYWETLVLAGEDLSGGELLGAVFSVFPFPEQFGWGTNRNAIMGGDLQWRPTRWLQLDGQLAIDDLRLGANRRADGSESRPPNRYALTVGASGPLAGTAGWRALYSRTSSLAYRTFDRYEDFTEQGVGLARTTPDNEVWILRVTRPVTDRWLVTPELILLRQGEGRLQAPFPPDGDVPGEVPFVETPEFLLGTVRTTARAGVAWSGRTGPLAIQGEFGVHRIWNDGHVEGRTVTRAEGRLRITLGWSLAAALE